MTDKNSDAQNNYDPADQVPAEGQSHAIPAEDRGKNPGVDPAAKDAPAEGGRDEVERQAERDAKDPRGV